MEALVVLALLIGASAAIYLASRPKKKKTDAASLRRELVRLTHDDAAAQRLIDAEARRRPDATEKELIEHVIARLRYERRR